MKQTLFVFRLDHNEGNSNRQCSVDDPSLSVCLVHGKKKPENSKGVKRWREGRTGLNCHATERRHQDQCTLQ
jgi:hypothetical protein